MEAIVFGFKKPLNVKTETSNNNESLKSKDFSSTLESQSKKVNDKNTHQKTSNFNEDRKETVSSKDKELKENKEINMEPKEDDEKKENFLVYGNMVFFINNIADTEDIAVNNEETELNLTTDIKSVTSEENSMEALNSDEIFAEDKAYFIIAKQDIVDQEIPRTEIELDNSINANNNENIKENYFNNKELKLESKVKQNDDNVDVNEEVSESIETKLPHIDQLANKMEFTSGENRDFQSSAFEHKLDSIEVEESDKDIEVDDETFITTGNKSIEFAKNDLVQLDKPDVIDRKEVIQQIVDKVKINFSEVKNEIKVTLKPEVLGEMTMNIEVIKGSVTAKIMVDNQRTKEIIEGNLIQLKEGIKDTGLEIKTVEVFVGNNSDFERHNQSGFRQNNKRIKIKSQDKKEITRYGEQPVENGSNSNEVYSDSSLNLFA